MISNPFLQVSAAHTFIFMLFHETSVNSLIQDILPGLFLSSAKSSRLAFLGICS